MLPDEVNRQRQFSQAYGSKNASPLNINIISEEVANGNEQEVYLLIDGNEGPASAAGFADLKRSFTFAFTTKELAESFVTTAKKLGLLMHVGRVLPMRVSEFFERKKQGWTKSDICLDPSPSMLDHPNIRLGIQESN